VNQLPRGSSCIFLGIDFCWASRLDPDNWIADSQEQRVFLPRNNFLPLESRVVYRLVFALAQDTVMAPTRPGAHHL